MLQIKLPIHYSICYFFLCIAKNNECNPVKLYFDIIINYNIFFTLNIIILFLSKQIEIYIFKQKYVF
jgi:hypothetical protein